jgi:hypothetical protein
VTETIRPNAAIDIFEPEPVFDPQPTLVVSVEV